MQRTEHTQLLTRRSQPDRYAQGLLNRLAWGMGIDLYVMDGYGLGQQPWDKIQDDLRFLLDPHVSEITGRQAQRTADRITDLMATWYHDETWRQAQELVLLFKSVHDLALVDVDEALRLVSIRTDVV